MQPSATAVLYIHDTIETFGGSLEVIREQWESNVKPTLQARAIRQVEHAPETYFKEMDDSIREAARIAVSRNLSPEMVREVCDYGWRQAYGKSDL